MEGDTEHPSLFPTSRSPPCTTGVVAAAVAGECLTGTPLPSVFPDSGRSRGNTISLSADGSSVPPRLESNSSFVMTSNLQNVAASPCSEISHDQIA